jgi:hypothetical protein
MDPSSPIATPAGRPQNAFIVYGKSGQEILNILLLLLRYHFDVRVFESLRNRRERSCSMSHAQQRKYRIGEQFDRKRSARPY